MPQPRTAAPLHLRSLLPRPRPGPRTALSAAAASLIATRTLAHHYNSHYRYHPLTPRQQPLPLRPPTRNSVSITGSFPSLGWRSMATTTAIHTANAVATMEEGPSPKSTYVYILEKENRRRKEKRKRGIPNKCKSRNLTAGGVGWGM